MASALGFDLGLLWPTARSRQHHDRRQTDPGLAAQFAQAGDLF